MLRSPEKARPTAENTACTSIFCSMAEDSIWLKAAILAGSSSFAATSSTNTPPQATSWASRRKSLRDRGSLLLRRAPALRRRLAMERIRFPVCREVISVPSFQHPPIRAPEGAA